MVGLICTLDVDLNNFSTRTETADFIFVSTCAQGMTKRGGTGYRLRQVFITMNTRLQRRFSCTSKSFTAMLQGSIRSCNRLH